MSECKHKWILPLCTSSFECDFCGKKKKEFDIEQENKRLREALETFRPMMVLLENMPSCALTSKERKMYALMQAALEVIAP